jgi:Sulfotransferase family
MVEPIIIVGPGRCGTSCVAGVLHRLGVVVGLRLLPGDETNPFGHYEDCEFLHLNASVLSGKITQSEWTEQTGQIIEARRALGRPWGWKDPRTCVLLRHYLQFFNDPKFVRCVRDPAEIDASAIRAYSGRGWDANYARTLRSKRERELDRYLPWYKTFEINFDKLRQNREPMIRSLVEFCGLSDVSQATIHSAVEFVRPVTPTA